MKNKWLVFIIMVLFLIPNVSLALSKSYSDKVYDIVGEQVEKDKVNIYFFHTDGCPHCAKGKIWLEKVKKQFKSKVNIYEYEVHDEQNSKYLELVKQRFNTTISSYPFIVIGDKFYVGFSDMSEKKLDNIIESYVDNKKSNSSYSLPILGKINAKSISIPLVAIILGFIDGFNPCAMWVLLFLITMLLGMKNKKRRWILGFCFLFTSALVYFLSILGISVVLGITAVSWIKKLIGVVALVAGILNLKSYYKDKKEKAGCDVVDDKKRKKMFARIKKFTNERSFILAILGVIALAASVNLVELACSLGFPMIFTEILALNHIHGLSRILYLLVYILFYMIDDIIVFIVSMVALEATGFTNKYNKFSHLIGGILMLIMAILLIFKPEWLMFNFN